MMKLRRTLAALAVSISTLVSLSFPAIALEDSVNPKLFEKNGIS